MKHEQERSLLIVKEASLYIEVGHQITQLYRRAPKKQHSEITTNYFYIIPRVCLKRNYTNSEINE